MQRAPACKVSGNLVRELSGQGQRRGHEGFAHSRAGVEDGSALRREALDANDVARDRAGEVCDHALRALGHAHQPGNDRRLPGVQHTPSDFAGRVGGAAAEDLVEETVPLLPLLGLREATLCGVGLKAKALARDAEQVLEAEGRDGAGEGCGHRGPWVARVGQRRLLYVLLELEGRQDVAQGEPVAGWSLRRPLEGPLAHELLAVERRALRLDDGEALAKELAAELDS